MVERPVLIHAPDVFLTFSVVNCWNTKGRLIIFSLGFTTGKRKKICGAEK